jgi:hypothetical protein
MHVKCAQSVNKETYASAIRMKHYTLYFRFNYLKANMSFELELCL